MKKSLILLVIFSIFFLSSCSDNGKQNNKIYNLERKIEFLENKIIDLEESIKDNETEIDNNNFDLNNIEEILEKHGFVKKSTSQVKKDFFYYNEEDVVSGIKKD